VHEIVSRSRAHTIHASKDEGYGKILAGATLPPGFFRKSEQMLPLFKILRGKHSGQGVDLALSVGIKGALLKNGPEAAVFGAAPFGRKRWVLTVEHACVG
jgi:hypothetical protein